jgi:hypothetical protein
MRRRALPALDIADQAQCVNDWWRKLIDGHHDTQIR